MIKFIVKLVLFAVAVYVSAYFVPGIEVIGWRSAAIASIVLGLLNTFVKPFVQLLAFPVNFITLGLFTIVINAGMILLCELFVPKCISVEGFMPALIYSVMLAVLSWVLNFIFLRD